MKRFRTIWRFLVPGWLSAGEGELVQYVEGLFLDAFAERCAQSPYLMLPSVAPDDALDRIGSDRAIPRGFAEPEGSYRERLIRWRFPRGHRVRGNASGLLEQISAVFGGTANVQTIDARGTRYTAGTDGPERGVTWDWDGAGLTPLWARFWIYLDPADVAPWPSFDDGAWGGVVDNPEVCHDMQGVHPGQIAAVVRLCRVGRLSWTPAGRLPVYLVTDVNGSGFPAPTGDWDEWANRNPLYAYTPLHVSIT